jgi:hypothetical protein
LEWFREYDPGAATGVTGCRKKKELTWKKDGKKEKRL